MFRATTNEELAVQTLHTSALKYFIELGLVEQLWVSGLHAFLLT